MFGCLQLPRVEFWMKQEEEHSINFHSTAPPVFTPLTPLNSLRSSGNLGSSNASGTGKLACMYDTCRSYNTTSDSKWNAPLTVTKKKKKKKKKNEKNVKGGSGHVNFYYQHTNKTFPSQPFQLESNVKSDNFEYTIHLYS